MDSFSFVWIVLENNNISFFEKEKYCEEKIKTQMKKNSGEKGIDLIKKTLKKNIVVKKFDLN